MDKNITDTERDKYTEEHISSIDFKLLKDERKLKYFKRLFDRLLERRVKKI